MLGWELKIGGPRDRMKCFTIVDIKASVYYERERDTILKLTSFSCKNIGAEKIGSTEGRL
jgi:hypothetical protein